MLYFHPVIMALADLIALYALWLGFKRFQSLHLGRAVQFKRSAHARWGAVALLAWLGGAAGGALVVDLLQPSLEEFINGHEELGMTIVWLAAVGGLIGLYLYFRPAKRTVLPALHGLINLTALVLALAQFVSGWRILSRALGN